MKKIRWKHSEYSARADVGSVRMSCIRGRTTKNKRRWVATIYVPAVVHYAARKLIQGQWRQTLDQAKQDAVDLTRTYFLDFHAGLEAEMENFGIVGETCDE